MKKVYKMKQSLIAFIGLFLVIVIILLILLLNNNTITAYTTNITSREMDKYSCLYKGEICSEDDIDRGIKVHYRVSDKEAYDFYVLSNDEEKVTLIMATNIQNKVDWHSELINLKGPTSALEVLTARTQEWINVPVIESYKYEDEGNGFYKKLCSQDLSDEEVFYDCKDDKIKTRGYNGFSIKDGLGTLYFNLEEEKDYEVTKQAILTGRTFRARLVEQKDLTNLILYRNTYPDWLIDNLKEEEGYWTMSSSTLPLTQYREAAFAVVNYKSKTLLRELLTIAERNKNFKTVGIRPVITIEKIDKEKRYTSYGE